MNDERAFIISMMVFSFLVILYINHTHCQCKEKLSQEMNLRKERHREKCNQYRYCSYPCRLFVNDSNKSN